MTATYVVAIVVVFTAMLASGVIALALFLILDALKEFRQDLRYFYPLLQRERVFDEKTNGGANLDTEVKIPDDWEFWAEKEDDG